MHPGQAEQAGTTSMLSCRASAFLTSTLVIWSSTTTRDDDDELELPLAQSADHAGAAGASASTQRGHSPSVPASRLTAGTTRQQRSHLTPSARSTVTRRGIPSAPWTSST